MKNSKGQIVDVHFVDCPDGCAGHLQSEIDNMPPEQKRRPPPAVPEVHTSAKPRPAPPMLFDAQKESATARQTSIFDVLGDPDNADKGDVQMAFFRATPDELRAMGQLDLMGGNPPPQPAPAPAPEPPTTPQVNPADFRITPELYAEKYGLAITPEQAQHEEFVGRLLIEQALKDSRNRMVWHEDIALMGVRQPSRWVTEELERQGFLVRENNGYRVMEPSARPQPAPVRVDVTDRYVALGEAIKAAHTNRDFNAVGELIREMDALDAETTEINFSVPAARPVSGIVENARRALERHHAAPPPEPAPLRPAPYAFEKLEALTEMALDSANSPAELEELATAVEAAGAQLDVEAQVAAGVAAARLRQGAAEMRERGTPPRAGYPGEFIEDVEDFVQRWGDPPLAAHSEDPIYPDFADPMLGGGSVSWDISDTPDDDSEDDDFAFHRATPDQLRAMGQMDLMGGDSPPTPPRPDDDWFQLAEKDGIRQEMRRQGDGLWGWRVINQDGVEVGSGSAKTQTHAKEILTFVAYEAQEAQANQPPTALPAPQSPPPTAHAVEQRGGLTLEELTDMALETATSPQDLEKLANDVELAGGRGGIDAQIAARAAAFRMREAAAAMRGDNTEVVRSHARELAEYVDGLSQHADTPEELEYEAENIEEDIENSPPEYHPAMYAAAAKFRENARTMRWREAGETGDQAFHRATPDQLRAMGQIDLMSGAAPEPQPRPRASGMVGNRSRNAPAHNPRATGHAGAGHRPRNAGSDEWLYKGRPGLAADK